MHGELHIHTTIYSQLRFRRHRWKLKKDAWQVVKGRRKKQPWFHLWILYSGTKHDIVNLFPSDNLYTHSSYKHGTIIRIMKAIHHRFQIFRRSVNNPIATRSREWPCNTPYKNEVLTHFSPNSFFHRFSWYSLR